MLTLLILGPVQEKGLEDTAWVVHGYYWGSKRITAWVARGYYPGRERILPG